MKKILFITLAACALSFFASSCSKENDSGSGANDVITARLDSLSKQVASLEKTQTALNDSLKNIKGDVEKLSKQGKALTDSISAVKDSLAAQKEWTAVQLDAIVVRLNAIEKAQSDFKSEVYYRLGRLESRIQKIDVIPEYRDGSVYIGKGDVLVNFIVQPDSIAEKLSGKDSIFTFFAVPTRTKSASNSEYMHLDIKQVSYRDGTISVRVNGSKLPDAYFEGTQAYNACLKISDGNSSNTSGFFPLYYYKGTTDLCNGKTSNCYIVTKAGDYKFKATVKGCTDSAITPTPTTVSVLWETFGTSYAPAVGDLVNNVKLSGDSVYFSATGEEGNALIAVTDGTNILWSWHIWLTDQPAEQIYNNNAGTMMDRNLGATSATAGHVGALGLLYQWGRKDPFLSSSSINTTIQAASTITAWPEPVDAKDNASDAKLNLNYSIANPTTFIKNNEDPYDWYCTQDGAQYRNDTLWKHSSGSVKTMYDPCPAGWRVPDGGASGIWKTAGFQDTSIPGQGHVFDSKNKGMDFCDFVTPRAVCWYPTAGCLRFENGLFEKVGINGDYWACNRPSDDKRPWQSYNFNITSLGTLYPQGYDYRADGQSVRCVKL